ncbi:MAG: hypothetical protein EBS01_11945, partial [Verrucomicrobia bacterium]|nr:hypothetical protein [Verrucomicrobiota bacterium]
VEKLAWSPFLATNVPRKEAVPVQQIIAAIRLEAEQCFLKPGLLVGGEAAFKKMLERLDNEVWNSPLLAQS